MIGHCVVHSSHSAPRFAFAKRGTDIYVCPQCGCIMGDLSFAAHQYESPAYYTIATADPAAIEREWGFRWRYVLQRIRRLHPGARLLDVGAGNGYFVHLARQEFGLDAHGVEISQAEIDFAGRVFGVALQRPEDLPPAGDFDVLTSFNVLEHVEQPLQLLERMLAHLRPGGLLVLTTPNPGCIHRRVKGLKDWGMVDPPHHINLFTREALEEAMTRAGFRPLGHATLSTYVRFVRRFDRGNLLRRSLFYGLMAFGLGADHLVLCRRAADAVH
jgi:SAM-dependent methyltransferase